MSDEMTEKPMIETPADFGHFLLVKELGHGGMGGVYLARDKMLDRKVAIKVMLKQLGSDPKFVERFQREAQAAARLNHPNIAQIYSFGQEQGMPYIAMELVPGGSLDKDMEANPGTLDQVRVMRIGQQLVDALALAADQGLVHGDVKPENVLYADDGTAKLVDFGLAAMQGDSNEIWGTPYYISPEKCRRQKIDFRADIYSLGGTLYHALTGQPPFEGADANAVVRARFDGPPPKPSEVRPDLSPEIDAIIMRMLELEPAMRYPTYQSLMGDIKRYLAKAGPSSASAKNSGPRVRIKGRKPKMQLPGAKGDDAIAVLDGNAVLSPVTEERRVNLGLVIGGVIAGVVLLILLVAGGLLWYVHAEKEGEEKAAQAELVSKIKEGRDAIETTKKAIQHFGENFNELVEKCDKEMVGAVNGIKSFLPEELREPAGAFLALPPTADIASAIAYTNKLLGAIQPAAAANAKAAAATNAPSASAKAATAQDIQAMMAAALTSGKPATPEQIEKLAKRVLASAKDANGEPLDSASPEYTEALDKLKASPEFAMFAQIAAVNPAAVSVITKPLGDPANIEKAMKEMGGKLGVKADAKPAEKPAEEKPTEEEKKKVVVVPTAVMQMGDLWKDVYFFRAANMRVQAHVIKLLQQAETVNGMIAEDRETVEKIGELSHQLKEGLSSLRAEKFVELTQRRAGDFHRKAGTLVKAAQTQIARAKAKAEQAAKEAAEKAAKAEAEAKAAEEHKAKIAEETALAQTTFDGLVGLRLKTLDWDRALKELERVLGEMTTLEGKDAMRTQKKKVECMKAMHQLLISKSKGFQFKNGLMVNATVAETDAKTITIQGLRTVRGEIVPDGDPKKLDWTRFFGKKEYVGYMNQMINQLVMKGRATVKTSARAWSEQMFGAALVLQLLYSEVEGAAEFAPTLVKKAAEDFEPSRRWAKKMFPEIEIGEKEQ